MLEKNRIDQRLIHSVISIKYHLNIIIKRQTAEAFFLIHQTKSKYVILELALAKVVKKTVFFETFQLLQSFNVTHETDEDLSFAEQKKRYSLHLVDKNLKSFEKVKLEQKLRI